MSDNSRKSFINRLNYSIALGFFEIEELEKSSKYLDTIYQTALKNNDKDYIEAYLGLKGAVLFRQGQYPEALEHTNAYLYNSQPNEPYEISRSNVIKGLTLWEMNAKEEAMTSFYIADSIYQETKEEFEVLGEAYTKMVAYFKQKKDASRELEYVNKLLAFNEEITSNYLEIAPAIQREYTVPKLLEEKEKLIAQLDNSISSKSRLNLILELISAVLLILGLLIVSKNIKYRKRYNQLLKELERKKKQAAPIQPSSLKELEASQIKLIASGLEKFELRKDYLNNQLTLKSLAKSIDTNSAYLSKYVNAVKEQNFSHYINDLRINYTLDKLAENRKWHTYTIEAIGQESGFATARSFTTHFKRVTGISASYFIKNIQKEGDLPNLRHTTAALRPQTE